MTARTTRELVRLTRGQRRELIRAGQAFYRQHRDVDVSEVADVVAGLMFENEEEWGLTEAEAIAISDYAYGVAQWVCPREIL